MITILCIFIFVLNALIAFGIRLFLRDTNTLWIERRSVRLVLLIPPLAFILLLGIITYGVFFTMYWIIADYLK